ncbi:MAG: alpha-amylase family glycosyl hydrolase, partial [Myxococcota bacterium]|nr:alpha-amylase family glycosyl hydrolase [Myxococcota bacterium]
GDGVGDLEGLRRRLPYLASLGVDVLWLSPVHPSPNVDFGYDVSDYQGVHPDLGSVEELVAVIAAARALGLRVLLDGVFNHTSDQHPWFQASCMEPEGPYGGFYLWRDGRDGRPPNNWGSTFGGAAWRFVAARGQWVLHSFAPEQPDLNWRNPAVVDAVLDSMAFWLERGVCGFRLDVFNCYLKDEALRDNPRRRDLKGLAGGAVYPFIGQHHIHDRDHPDLRPVLQRMRRLADAYDAVLVGETLDETLRYDNAAQWVGPDRLHLAFHFRLLHSRWSARAFVAAIAAWTEALGPAGWPTWVLSNHDFPRVATRWGGREDRARLAAFLVCTLRGTPFLYQGDELGMRQARLPRDRIQDPPGRRFWPLYRGRDGARTPMQWEAGPAAGFTHGTPWLPVQDDRAVRNVAAMEATPGSLLRFWRTALAARRGSTDLLRGPQVGPDLPSDAVIRYARGRARVMLNLGDRPVRVALSGADRRPVLLSTHGSLDRGPDGLRLRTCEGVALGPLPEEMDPTG